MAENIYVTMAEDAHAKIAALTARAEKAEAERDEAREQRRRWQEASAADRAEAQRLREVLVFYADPSAWMKARGVTDKHIPDFYSELCFGEMAQDALCASQQSTNQEG